MTGTANTLVLLDIAIEEFARRLRLVGPGDWRRPTPCTEWDVRALVNHVVGANVRYQLLLHGAQPDQIEATRSVDHLGDDALASFVATAGRMVACFHEDGALERVAHHVIGDRTGSELVSMRILDAAVHAWDLARAIGADETLNDDVVAFLLAYSLDLELGPQGHAFATTYADVSRNASPQDQLLHRLGRHPNTEEIR
ncbi:TIGR03086 family metal-binding protein [Kribbella sp. NPDC051620]|uniref:TIGR03086 family metal-binding protein n=1 Tax=Kribbella sp. NPDC051620 TaxID=3364120 RepID=UPI0037882D82